MEKVVKRKFFDECRFEFAKCKKLEDASVMINSLCTTSRMNLENKLTDLFTAEDIIIKMQRKASYIFQKESKLSR